MRNTMETVVANFDDVLTVQDSTLICRGRFALLHETIQNRGMSVRNFYFSLKGTVGMAFSYKTSPQPRRGGCGGRGVVLGVWAAGLGAMGWQEWPGWPTATATDTNALTALTGTTGHNRTARIRALRRRLVPAVCDSAVPFRTYLSDTQRLLALVMSDPSCSRQKPACDSQKSQSIPIEL